MGAINSVIEAAESDDLKQDVLVSGPISGAELTVGSGFTAQSFRARDVGELMDPLLMVDHYEMTLPTFGQHPHAGMSAVSLLFEDSRGDFHNIDSLGNDLDLRPGDLYWLSAGRGAVHDESPRKGAHTHGLQVFVNVPQAERSNAPTSRLVRSEDMPVIEGTGVRVKVAMGESNGVQGASSPSTPMTILDGTLESGKHFLHEALGHRGIWIQSVNGPLSVVVGETTRELVSGQAVAIQTADVAEIKVSNPSSESVQFALFDGVMLGSQ